MRFLTLNLWGDNGPWQDRMALLADSLGDIAPEVIGLQEVRDVPGRVPNQAAELARRFGWQHVFAPSTAWGGGHEGLAVVSRFPIGAHDVRPLPHSADNEGRIILSARLDGDAGGIWVHTTHLSFREHEGRKREDQVLALDAAVVAHANDNIQVVMGDFNCVPDSDEIRWLTGMTTLDGRRVAYQDAWERMHPGDPGYTWARENPYVDKLHWLRPDRRLDYIFVTPVRRDRRGTIRAARIVLGQPRAAQPSGALVYASDHFGVVVDVQTSVETVEDARATS